MTRAPGEGAGGDGELAALAAQRARLLAVEAELRDVDAQLRQLRSSGQRWQRQAARAADELARLSGWTPAALLARMTGRAAVQRGAQQQRIDEARREQHELERREEPLVARREALAAECLALAPVQARHAAALHALEARLLAAGGADAVRCEQSARSLERLRGDERDASRAVERARAAAAALTAARDGLRDPHPQLGAARFRLFGTADRANAFDAARAHVERAQRELRDLGIGTGALTNVDELAPGAGTLLVQLAGGNLLADFVGRAQLSAARERIGAQLEHVRELALGLERRAATLRSALAAAQHERERWLETFAVPRT
jgi:hypothetical protein